MTATRRATNVQNTPLSVTAVGGAQLTQLGISNPTQLNQVVPNLDITQGYASGNVRVSIRGLGLSDYSVGGVSPVALYIDDVYQALNFGVATQLFDVDRVEVLRGPQGTLFGKNSTAGALNYFSAPPRFRDEGYIDVDVGGGQFVHGGIEAMYNTPLIDNVLAVRTDIKYTGRNDYVFNEDGGGDLGHRQDVAGRLQFLWRPDNLTDATLKLAALKSTGDGTIYHGFTFPGVCATPNAPYFNCNAAGQPGPTYLSANDTASEIRPNEVFSNYGATLKVNRRVDDMTLTSVSAYERIDYQLRTNDDGEDYDFFHSIQQLNAYEVSQELRLATPAGRRVSGVFGLFGEYDAFKGPQTSTSTLYGPPLDYTELVIPHQYTTTGAAFGSVTFKVTDKLSLIGGLRYSHEAKRINLAGIDTFSGTETFSPYGYNIPGAISEAQLLRINPLDPPFAIEPGDITFSQYGDKISNKLTGDATIDYQVTHEVLLYARYAEGFRSGGFNTLASTPDSIATLQPEDLTSYEIGVKSEYFQRRLRLNGDFYYYDYTNEQVQSTNGTDIGVRLTNAGSSTIKGFELEAEALPIRGLDLKTSIGYTDSVFDHFNTIYAGNPISLAGNELPYAPKWTTDLSASYQWCLPAGFSLTALSDWSYRSRVYYDPFNLGVTSDPESITGNARFTLASPGGQSSGYTVAFYVDNLTNHKDVSFAYFVDGANISQVYADLRTFGFEFRKAF